MFNVYGYLISLLFSFYSCPVIHTICISELPYHSNKPPGRRPHPTKANNRRVAQGAVGQPIDTTGQLPDNTTECKAGL